MVTTDVELQLAQQLREAGKLLSDPPASDDDLLHILDQTEKLLSKVDQSPNAIMLAALHPSMKALVEGSLLRHSNVDVKIAVAACLSEITRVTAPDAPYSDEEMKDVFRLIVSSLENLSDTSSRSYEKKSSILETLYKVRSCVILLDLECNVLIVEMFEHFLKSVRDHHLGSIFTWMMNIMVLVLEESEDISIYMLKPLLASIKNNTEGVLPVARKLGEAVLQKSADKLKPYLIETLRILGDSLDNYSQVLASICEGTTDVVEHNDENASVQRLTSDNKLAKVSSNEAPQADESKLTTASSDNAAQAVRGNAEGTFLGEADATSNRSLKSVTGNGIMITGNEEGTADKESSKKLEEAINHPDSNLTSKVDTDASVTEKLAMVGSNSAQTSNRRGKKSDTILKAAKPSDSSHGHGNEAEKLPNNQSSSKDIRSSPCRESSLGAVIPSEIEKKTDSPVSVPKPIESYVANAPSQSSSLPDESHVKKDGLSKKQVLPQQVKVSLPYKRRKKGGRSKKKSLCRDDASSMDIVSMEPVLAKAPEGTSDSDMKSPKRGRKKAPVTKEDKHPPKVATLEDAKATSGPDIELLETSSKKVDTVDSESTPVKRTVRRRGKKVGAGDSVAKKNKLSGKKIDDGDSEAKKPKEAGKSTDAADPEGEPSRPSLIKEEGCDSDSKPPRQSAKDSRKRKIITKPSGNTANKEEGSDSDDKLLKLSAKKGNTSGPALVKSSSKNKSGKKRGHGKCVEEKEQEKSLSEDDGMDVTLQSALKTATGEGNLEEALTTTVKRKRSSGKKVIETIKYDDSLVGLKVKVWWPEDKTFYDGVIESYDSKTYKHKVLYEDNEEEILNLKKEKWEIVQGISAHTEEKAAEVQSTDDLAETPKKKKSRIDSGPSASEEKLKVSAKRAGGDSLSSKSRGRGRPAKSAGSSKGEGKVDSKAKDTSIKSKPQKSSVKSVQAADSKEAGISEEDDVETPEIINKNKQGNRKMVNKCMVKTPQTGKKVDANDSSKPKSMEKEDEDAEGTPETAKEKPAEILKTATKSQRKRKKRT
ncbi:microtubule-associated protein futsch-like isoform X2 [Cynara cardunculus var. scolymus]|uniref:microtubule-associated protein futsch-like isoform X2 n=1 Tax=Cynara cardunculus var. scolymus TaxID=59895 RepID=UPI000D623716|nr:microtubule-associated protein futsch-like isoform X2 [Cynara cardunculus var. scolymus]